MAVFLRARWSDMAIASYHVGAMGGDEWGTAFPLPGGGRFSGHRKLAAEAAVWRCGSERLRMSAWARRMRERIVRPAGAG